METYQIEIREKQKQSWNSFSQGWKRWDDFTMRFLHSQAVRIIESLRLKPDDHVLDIACGTGEPGMTAASIVHQGFVTATDLAEGMLQIAKEKSSHKKLNNFHTLTADVCELPFDDASFDAISCRLGFMFFPDMQMAAHEMYRVLKPGGRIAVTVWAGPENNPWITALMGVISRHVELSEVPKDAPGLFRCARSGCVTALFKEAGFSGIMETEIKGMMACDSVDEYWNFLTAVVPPVVMALKEKDNTIVSSIKSEVDSILNERFPGKRKNIPFEARLVTGGKLN